MVTNNATDGIFAVGETVMAHTPDRPRGPDLAEDPWDVFELDDEGLEPEPEHGDFWGELDDDYGNGS